MAFREGVSILIYLFCVPAIFGSPTDSLEEVRNSLFNEGRIIGGQNAKPGEMRAIVGLVEKKGVGGFCGGSLIKPNVVLTAAHCVNNTKESDWKVIGDLLSLTQQSLSHAQMRSVKTIKIHENYMTTEKYSKNDIAVLILKNPFSIHAFFHPLNLTQAPPVDYENCRVAGWGTEKENGKMSEQLKIVEIPVIPKSLCNSTALLGWVPEGAFCAGALEGGRDSCQGDSGGGLICNGTIKGIVSYGFGCGRQNRPGVYMNVFEYRDWIQRNTGNVHHVAWLFVFSTLLVAMLLH